MRSTAKSPVYISAYPLKAVKESAVNSNQPHSPYLKALLSGTNKTTTGNSSPARVLSLSHSNRPTSNPVAFDRNKLPKDIELTDKDWFKNYE
jgi:hypothetical protein